MGPVRWLDAQQQWAGDREWGMGEAHISGRGPAGRAPPMNRHGCSVQTADICSVARTDEGAQAGLHGINNRGRLQEIC